MNEIVKDNDPALLKVLQVLANMFLFIVIMRLNREVLMHTLVYKSYVIHLFYHLHINKNIKTIYLFITLYHYL